MRNNSSAINLFPPLFCFSLYLCVALLWSFGLCVSFSFMCSGSDQVQVHNLLRALQATRSLSVHSHIQGKIQTNKVRVAVLISGTGESYVLYCSVKWPIEKGTSAQI